MSEPSLPPPDRPRRRRLWLRVLLIFLLLMLLTVGIGLGVFFWNRHLADEDLAAAIAETDQLEPAWRLADIERRRGALKDDQNAAVPLRAAFPLFTEKTFDNRDLQEMASTAPNARLRPEDAAALRKAMEPLAPALAHLRKALPLKHGYYPVQWTDDVISTLVPHLLSYRQLAQYLDYDAMLRNEDGDHAEACRSDFNVLAICRAIGEEPMAIALLVRIALRAIALAGLERTLAQGTVPEELLAEAQRQFAEEATAPLALYMMRGERAGMHQLATNFVAGKVGLVGKGGKEPAWYDAYILEARYSQLVHDHAFMLRWFNEAVEIAKLPPHQRRSEVHALEDKAREQSGVLSKLLLPAYTKLFDADIRTQAQLQCAVAGIAAERFRLKTGRWPNSLDELVTAGLLDKVPLDPCDGKPLQLRKTADGLVIYSVGLDGDYTGHEMETKAIADILSDLGDTFVRYEFRLWDEPHRRQPAPPPRPKPKDPDDANGK